jgi:hypothetical protein
MTHNEDFIERLESYLDEYEGDTPLPDAVRDAIRAELPRTKQIGPVAGLPRFLSMTLQLPTPARYGLAAAVVLVAVIIGANVFSGDNTGDPSASPTPPSAASASPAAGGPWSLLDSPRAGDIPVGDYYLDHPDFPARIDFAVPEGWWYYWSSASRAASDVHATLVNSMDTVGSPNGSAWGVGFTVVDDVWTDPCDPEAGTINSSVTESADALADAFGSWPDFPVVSVEDVSLGGYSGKRVEMTHAEGIDCEATFFRTPTGYRFGPEFPSIDPVVNQFTFLDVDGSVLVIWTTDFPATTMFEEGGGASPDARAHADEQVELHEILDSIVITPR